MCLDFLNLLFSRLLQLLTIDDLLILHETANKILLLWMQLMKVQNPKIYKELLNKSEDLLLGRKILYLFSVASATLFAVLSAVLLAA